MEDLIKPTDESTLHKVKQIDVNKLMDAYVSYKAAREKLDAKIIENENWFKQEYWQYLIANADGSEPKSGTLLNAILNKHADFMDNEPTPVLLAREQSDEPTTEILTKVIPVVLKNAKWDDTYSKYTMYLIKQGLGCLSPTWDQSLDNGLGNIVINYIDILRMYWEPNCTDIQDSRYVFVDSLIDTDILKDQYDLDDNQLPIDSQEALQIKTYEDADRNILSNKTVVTDCYERTLSKDGRQIVHLTKIANYKVLESSILNPDTSDTGIYEHGMYPFIIGQYVPLEGTLEGMGLIDMNNSNQAYVDKMDILSLKNGVVASKQRWLVKKDGGINAADLMDLSKDVVESESSVDENAVRPIQAEALPAFVPQIRENKIQEMKELSGNRDFNQGGTSGGVTAFGAIAALQEAGNKTTRDNVKALYRDFEKLIGMVVELVREFYSEDRQFRITGENKKPEYVTFNNQGMVNQITNLEEAYITLSDGTQISNPDWEPTYRKPVYDIEIVAQKKNPFNTISHNQMMLELFKMGAFNPEAAVSSAMLIDNMIFDGKEKLLTKIKENGDLYQQMQQMQQQAQQMAQQYEGVLQEQNAYIEQLKGNIDNLMTTIPLQSNANNK